jgi:hypothetical protein
MQVVRKLDESKWLEFVEHHPQANIFHSPEMFQVFEKTKDFSPELWAVVGSHGEVKCLFNPILNTVLNGALKYFSTRAVAYGSILSMQGPESSAVINSLLNSYNQTKKNLLFTELRNQSDHGDIQPALNQNGFIYEDHLNFLFDLTLPTDTLWKNIRSNARRNIRKAEKSKVMITEVEDVHQLSAAYRILKSVYSRIQVPLPDFTMFEAGFKVLKPKGMLKILLAKVGEKPIGTLTLLMYKGTITYWYTGILREFASYRAGDLLVWNAIVLGKQGGFHTFDFGGGGKPDEEYGVRDFKAKFGGDLVNFGRNIKIHAPIRYQVSLVGYNLLRKFL